MIDNKLRIVAGNTFATAHTITANDVQGQPIPDFDLQQCTDIQVYARNGGNYKQVTSWQTDDQSVVVLWYGKQMKLGGYDFYIAGKSNGIDWRTSEATIFEIVQYNEEANIPADTIVVDGTYFVDASFSLITEIQGGGGGATPSETLPLMDGEVSVGEENAYARGDHRHPSDTSKQDVIEDLEQIRSGAEKGDTAYQKPSGGIPSTDMDQAVQTSLGKANTAYQKPQNGIPATDLAQGVIPDVGQFITKSVDDLVNYYLKSETYTKTEVQALIAAINQFHYEVYPTLASVTDPQSNVLYLIGPIGSGTDKYEEYVYSNENLVKIGDTSIDLSGYVTTEALNTALSSYSTTTEMQQAISAALASYYTKTEADTLLSGKQNTLTFDNAPTEDSNNPVKSGGVYTALGGKEDKTNKVTSLSSSSTDTQYPSAKCVYDLVGDVETLLSNI